VATVWRLLDEKTRKEKANRKIIIIIKEERVTDLAREKKMDTIPRKTRCVGIGRSAKRISTGVTLFC